MHHNILLRFEVFFTFNYSTSKIANHNKYIMNRNSIKQKKAEDILSSCLFCKNWERFYLQKMFALRTIVFILFLCYNYLSCMSHRNFAELLRRCMENMEIELADEAAIMFLNTLGTNGDVSPDIQSLFDYINNNTVTSNFTREVADTITEIKNDKKVRDSYMTYEMRIKDTLAEGEAKGRVEGKAEGIAEEKLATAKRLLRMGLSVQDVAKGTSLSVEQVEKIKAEQA